VLIKKFEDLQTKFFVDVEGCRGHSQAYGLRHPWIILGLTWLHSPVKKNFTTKTSPTLFLRG
jgi:hypothetical protein